MSMVENVRAVPDMSVYQSMTVTVSAFLTVCVSLIDDVSAAVSFHAKCFDWYSQ